MRKLLPLALLAALAGTAALAGSASSRTTAIACSVPVVTKGTLSVGTDNPAYPPWYGGNQGHGWKVSDPYSGKGYESAVAYAIAEPARVHGKPKVKWVYVPFLQVVRAGQKELRLRHQPDLVPSRACEGRDVQRVLLRREAGDRRQERHADRERQDGRRPEAVHARGPTRDDELPVHQVAHQAGRDRRSTTRTHSPSKR